MREKKNEPRKWLEENVVYSRRSVLDVPMVGHEHRAGWSVREWCIKIYITIKIQHIASTNKGNDLWNILFSIIYLFAFISFYVLWYQFLLLFLLAVLTNQVQPRAAKCLSRLENRHGTIGCRFASTNEFLQTQHIVCCDYDCCSNYMACMPKPDRGPDDTFFVVSIPSTSHVRLFVERKFEKCTIRKPNFSVFAFPINARGELAEGKTIKLDLFGVNADWMKFLHLSMYLSLSSASDWMNK